MAFSLVELHSLETDVTHAKVTHGRESLVAIIPESLERLESLSGDFLAELDYHCILKHEVSSVKMDSESGLFATDEPSVVIVDGSVSNLLEIDANHVLVDVYIQNGPEFVNVTSEELGGSVPKVGSRIRLWLKGLKIYPALT